MFQNSALPLLYQVLKEKQQENEEDLLKETHYHFQPVLDTPEKTQTMNPISQAFLLEMLLLVS